METTKRPAFMKWSLIVGIVIVLNLFFNYSLSLIYSAPEYQNFCPDKQVIESVTTKEACLLGGGQWNDASYYGSPVPVDVSGKAVEGYCNQNYTCQKNFDQASKVYDRNVFITLIILGVITMILGFTLKNKQVLATAFSWGGVLSFLIASLRYWSSADKLVRVLILGSALATLVWVGVKKFND